jgi:hypothetical protein
MYVRRNFKKGDLGLCFLRMLAYGRFVLENLIQVLGVAERGRHGEVRANVFRWSQDGPIPRRPLILLRLEWRYCEDS